MLLNTFRAHRLKGSCTYVKRDICAFDAFTFNGVQDVIIEMQAGCRRGNGAGLPGINSLVAVEVLCFI